MNLYDFDGTIYKKDSSLELMKFYLFKTFNIAYLFKILLFGFLKICGFIKLEKFKEVCFSFLQKLKDPEDFIKKFWGKQEKNIQAWYLNQKESDDVICSASPAFLVGMIMKKINPEAKIVCSNIDVQTGKFIEGEGNVKGESKVVILNELGYNYFDNVYTDSLSDFPIWDMTDNKWMVCGGKIFRFGEQKPTPKVKLKNIIKQLRIKHYIKNFLIFLPLFFSGLIKEEKMVLLTLVGFAIFCFSASIIYIINDLVDREKDRKHTTKRKRPIAAYMIKPYEAIIMVVILFAIVVFMLGFIFKFKFIIVFNVFAYIALNFIYSFWLKNLPIFDVFALALCYLVRVYFGASIIGVGVSRWLYLTILSAALYMSYGKRRNEIMKERETRKVNKKYPLVFLDKMIYLCLALCLVFYSLWAISFTIADLEHINLILLHATIPVVFFILMRYSYDIESAGNSGDPIEVLLSDKFMLFMCVIFVVLSTLAMYVPYSSIIK